MMGKTAQALLVALASLWGGQPASAEGLVRLASDNWCPYVCAKDNKITGGYLVEVTVKSMALKGIKVDPVFLPLNRAIRLTVSGDVEGVFAPPVDARLRLGTTIAHSRACFYTLSESAWRYRNIASLKGLRVGVIDDYGYDDGPMDDYVARNHAKSNALDFSFGATAGTTNIQKLLGGRFPVMLEHELVMQGLAKEVGAVHLLRQAGCLEDALPLTVGFALNDRRSAMWTQALSDGLKKLNASGELAAIRQRYNVPPDHDAAHRVPRQ
jgi:polar amino acid transport system substrate-binding protein